MIRFTLGRTFIRARNRFDLWFLKLEKITISPSRKEMGIAAGKCGERLLVDLLSEKETVRIIMGSAPSQDDVLGYLRECHTIDWSRVEVFHMDEYIGISPDSPLRSAIIWREQCFDALT